MSEHSLNGNDAFVVTQGLRITDLDAGYSGVFDSRTWQTHIVSGIAARVLKICIQHHYLTYGELPSLLDLPADDVSDQELHALTAQALDELLLVKLIKPAPPRMK